MNLNEQMNHKEVCLSSALKLDGQKSSGSTVFSPPLYRRGLIIEALSACKLYHPLIHCSKPCFLGISWVGGDWDGIRGQAFGS